MTVIDAHQHFWNYNPSQHAWIEDNMSVLKRDFLPEELSGIYEQNDVDGCVAVQADQSEDETSFLLDLADQYDFIKGVVGWTDLRSDKLEERLSYYDGFDKLKGFRHIVQSESDPEFMLLPEFQSGIAKLEKHELTYDILVFPHQLTAAIKISQNFPNQLFVIDHIAKPYIKSSKIDNWKKQLCTFSNLENVMCKVSGMTTEADWTNWKYAELEPYLDVVFEVFGTDRIMFGSDWPVCNLAGNYKTVTGIIEKYISSLTIEEQKNIWGNNARSFYNLG